MNMKPVGMALAVVSAVAVATPASAAIVVEISEQGSIQPPENVLFETEDVAASEQVGNTNQTDTEVTFRSTNSELLVAPSNGQARVESEDGSLSGVEFFISDPDAIGFTEFEFNLNNSLTDEQDAKITVTYFSSDTESMQMYTFDLKNSGSNFITGEATDGDYFTNVEIEILGGDGIGDLRQPRLGGIIAATVPGVPEPATWAMLLLGFFGIGGLMRWDRARRRVAVTYGNAVA